MEPKVEPRSNTVRVVLDEGMFPRSVGLAAAYRFIDRCYVLVEQRPRRRLEVRLKGKQPLGAEALRGLGGEFCNELVHQRLRRDVGERTEALRAAIVGRALLSAEPAGEGPGTAGETGAGSRDALDYLEDPLGIAVPWEEKHGDQRKAGRKQGGRGRHGR